MKSLTNIHMLKLTSETVLVLFIITVDQYVGVSSSSFKNTLMKVENIKILCFLLGHCTLLFLLFYLFSILFLCWHDRARERSIK